MKVLITAASTLQAQQLKQALPDGQDICMADEIDMPLFSLSGNPYIRIPPVSSASYLHLMLGICLDAKIDQLYPLRTEEIELLSSARDLFGEYGIILVVPRPDCIHSKGFSNRGKLVIRTEDEESGGRQRGVYIINEQGTECIFAANA